LKEKKIHKKSRLYLVAVKTAKASLDRGGFNKLGGVLLPREDDNEETDHAL